MKNILITTILLFIIASGQCPAQDINYVISQIELNNTSLKVLRQQAEAAKAESRTALNLTDPSIEAAYLWETQDQEAANRLDLSISQSFDFPTVYYWRKKVSDGECSMAELEYVIGLKSTLRDAELCCIDLIWLKSLRKELVRCKDNAALIVGAIQQKYDNGAAGSLELNSAKLSLLSATKSMMSNAVEIDEALSILKQLNGGISIDLAEEALPRTLLPADFEIWFEQACQTSSEIGAVYAMEKVAQSSTKLAGSQSLPKIQLGYTSERIGGSYLQGIGGGISIPLWENKGKVKAAKAREAASRAQVEDQKNKYYNYLHQLYSKARSLEIIATSYKETLGGLNSSVLLKEAFDGGQIGLEEYIVGMNRWLDAYSDALEIERDNQRAVCELNWFSR